MKVVIVTHRDLSTSTGGVEVYTSHLIKGLKKDFEVFLFSTITHPGKSHLSIEKKTISDVPSYFLVNNYPRPPFKLSYRNQPIDELFEAFLKEIRPDILHFQHLLYLSGGMVERASSLRIPLIMTLHDYYPLCPSSGKLLDRELRICDPIPIERCPSCYESRREEGGVIEEIFLSLLSRPIFSTLSPYPYRIFQRLPRPLKGVIYGMNSSRHLKSIKLMLSPSIRLDGYREDPRRAGEERVEYFKRILDLFTILISPSLFLKEHFIRMGFVHRDFRVIPHGVPLQDFRYRTVERHRRKGRKRLLYLGNLSPEKGLHLLIDAFSNPSPLPAELLIGGSMNIHPTYSSRLKRMARGEVRFLGEVSRSKVPPLLYGSDALILPSIWYENSPMSILEARGAGIPIIASRIGGVPEIVCPDRDGILFDPFATGEIRRVLEEIVYGDDLEKLKKVVEPPPDITENIQKIVETYSDALEG